MSRKKITVHENMSATSLGHITRYAIIWLHPYIVLDVNFTKCLKRFITRWYKNDNYSSNIGKVANKCFSQILYDIFITIGAEASCLKTWTANRCTFINIVFYALGVCTNHSCIYNARYEWYNKCAKIVMNMLCRKH